MEKDNKAELAYKDYCKGMKYKDIATKYDVSLNTVKSWKQRKWKDIEKGVQPKEKSVHTKCIPKQRDNAPPIEELLPEEIETLANEDIPDKQRLFCLYYVKYRNKVKAYQKAYGCSYITACGNASNLFKNIEVQQTITDLLDEMRNEIKIEAIDIINEHMKIAFADITDYISFGIRKDEDTGKRYTFIDFHDSSTVDGTLIQEVKQGRDGVSIKLKDGQKSLCWLYDHCVITEEQRARIDQLKAQTKKLEKDDNIPDDGAQESMDAVSGIAAQMQPIGDDEV